MFVSTVEKFGVELLLAEAEPPAEDASDEDGVLLVDEDGVLLDDVDGVLDDEDEDCATASVDSAKSTAAVVTLRVLDMDLASDGWTTKLAVDLRASDMPPASKEGRAIAQAVT